MKPAHSLLETRSRRTSLLAALVCTLFSGALLFTLERPRPVAAQEVENVNIQIPGTQGELATWIHERWAQVPIEVRNLDKAELKRTQILVDSLIEGCGHFLKNFPDGTDHVEIQTVLAQCMSLNRQRHRSSYSNSLKAAGLARPEIREELKIEMKNYSSEILALCKKTLEKEVSASQKARLHIVTGDLLQYERQHLNAASHYRSCHSAQPQGPFAYRAAFARIKSLIDAGEYAAARKEAPEFLKQFPKSDRYPDLCFLVHLAYRREGLLEEGLAFWELVRPYLLAGARGKAVPGTEEDPWIVPEDDRGHWEDYYGRSLFYKGFYNFALMNYEQATEGFLAFLDYYDEVTELGIPLPQPLNVYRQFQAVPYNVALTVLINNAAPPVGAGESWSRDEKSGSRAPGVKNSLVIMCNANNAKNAQSRLLKELPELEALGTEIVWIAPPGRIKEDNPEYSLEAREAQFLELQSDLDYPGKFAFDIDRNIHNAYYINPGTASLFILDKSGKVRWHLIYPTHSDMGMIRKVIQLVNAEDVAEK